MRPQKIEDNQMLDGLFEIFRAKGYEGTSMSDMEQYSGLKKASLYHRFPGGKKEIAKAVLRYVEQWTIANIYEPLSNSDQSPLDRINLVIKNISALYDNGGKRCLLRAFSMETQATVFDNEIKEAMELWIAGFINLGKDLGYSEQVSMRKAKKALVSLQGSLVISNVLQDNRSFIEALEDIKELYTN